MGQFVGCLQGIGEAARVLDFPIVSGNVSLYNETQAAGILPTPAIGGVGIIADVEQGVADRLRARGRCDTADRRDLGLALASRPTARDPCAGGLTARRRRLISWSNRNGDFVPL